MLAALIIALVIAGALLVTTVVLASNLADKESDLQYAKRETNDYRDRYYANDRRDSFEIEKERKEHESDLRIAEAEAYAGIRIAEQDETNRVQAKGMRRLRKETAKAAAALEAAEMRYYGPGSGPDGDLYDLYGDLYGYYPDGVKCTGYTEGSEPDDTSENPPFPEVATTNEA